MKRNTYFGGPRYESPIILLFLTLIISFHFAHAYHWWNDPGTGPATGTFVFYHWPNMPVTYIIDNENLPAGVTFAGSVAPAFNTWQDVPTSRLTFQQNVNNTGIANFTWNRCAANPSAINPNWGINNDGRNEVAWLHNSELSAYGRGITTVNTDNGEIIDFTLLVNVDMSAGTDPTFRGVLTHELGHVIGIGHSAVGHPGFGFLPLPQARRPTMFPYAQNGDGNRLESLELDDILIVSRIYPETADNPPSQVTFSLTQQKISGKVLKGTNGSYARGVYVRFVNTANNDQQTAVLSDFFGKGTGDWDIPGLPTGNWFLMLNEISGVIYPAWIEADGVGSAAHTYTGFPEEYFDIAESNHDIATDRNSLPVWSNWNTRNVNMVTNEGARGDPSIRPWGVDLAPPAPPWYTSPDIWVDNDGDGIVNEANEPARGRSNNKLSARITNIGNANTSRYKVSFSFGPYTTNASAPFVGIGSVNETQALLPGISKVYTVDWDLTKSFIMANFQSQFWNADHFCVRVEIERWATWPLLDANPFNNSTQSNYCNVPVWWMPGKLTTASFYVYNHHTSDAYASLTYEARQKGWDVRFEGIEDAARIPMSPGEWIEVTAVLEPQPGTPPPEEGEPVLIDISQHLNGINVGGITMALQPPTTDDTWRRYSFSIHGGTAIPIGDFADDFELSYNGIVDIDYHFTPRLALVGMLGYNHFRSKMDDVDDTYWINLSLNLRYYWPIQLLAWSGLSFYIGAGPGIYIPKDGDTEFGANVGFGFNYELSPPISWELGTDYHWIFDPEIQFIHAHTGMVFRF